MSGLHALASARWYQRLIGAEQTTGFAGGHDSNGIVGYETAIRIDDGTVTGNDGNNAINLDGGSLTVNGGNISSCNTASGCPGGYGLDVSNGTTVNVYAGSIYGASGGIFSYDATINIHGGVINGGIYLQNSAIDIQGGRIIRGFGSEDGDAIASDDTGTISDGYIWGYVYFPSTIKSISGGTFCESEPEATNIVENHVSLKHNGADLWTVVPAVPTAKTGLIYNRQSQDLITGAENFTYALGTDFSTVPAAFSSTIPQGTNAGTYYVWSRYTGAWLDETTTQQGFVAEPITVTIAKANPEIISTPEANDTTYNGAPQALAKDLDPSEIGEEKSLTEGVGDDSFHAISFFRIDDIFSSLPEGSTLPATGFSPNRKQANSVVNYKPVRMNLQIPVLDLETELVTLPLEDSEWVVDGLGDRAGVLSGTHTPGAGYSVIAAHNTLSADEYGPFALLSTLEDNEMIFVNDAEGGMLRFKVYANTLVAPNGFDEIAVIAADEPNSLILVTCENESINGGYLNRRAVFAKPVE